ncbi:MAG: 30S ribosomal protein S3 [Elusimicrobia bacterium]|nr:MAG: 30S ribosomal protein S3 [Elusimicrobiota bacterium]
MGNKIHPKSVRLGYIQEWESKWFDPRQAPALIGEDFKIRQLVKTRFRLAAVSWIGIERSGPYLRVNIHTARPGVVIGKRGVDIESVRSQVEKLTKRKTFINVMEIKEPELDARLVGEAIAMQLERRINHRRALRRAMERTMQAGALGIKVQVKGRLNGAEIARREWNREGRVPLHTFCADIDYGLTEAHTSMGLIGVKVWIFKKTYFAKSPKELLKKAQDEGRILPVVEEIPPVAPLVPIDPEAEKQAQDQAAKKGAKTLGRKKANMPELPAGALAQLGGFEPAEDEKAPEAAPEAAPENGESKEESQ